MPGGEGRRRFRTTQNDGVGEGRGAWIDAAGVGAGGDGFTPDEPGWGLPEGDGRGAATTVALEPTRRITPVSMVSPARLIAWKTVSYTHLTLPTIYSV